MFGSTAAVYASMRSVDPCGSCSMCIWRSPQRCISMIIQCSHLSRARRKPINSYLSFSTCWGGNMIGLGPRGHHSLDPLMWGLTLDLNGLQDNGSIALRNKEGRIEKISAKILKIRDSGSMGLADAQEIHGLLNFATGYFAGRSLKYACFKIFSLIDKRRQEIYPIAGLVQRGPLVAQLRSTQDNPPRH